jgi:hypothetical protein
MRSPPRTISLFRAVNLTTSVSLHPTSHRGGRGTPTPRRCRGESFPVRGALPDFFFLTLRSPLPRASISGGMRQPDFSQDSGSGVTHTNAQNHGGNLIATCPKCASQLLIPPGVPTVACGSCGQAISPVVSGGNGAPAQPPGAQAFTRMVKCPLCAAVLQQPPGASLAVCGGCHQVIAMPGENDGGNAQPHASSRVGVDAGVGEAGMPPIIACPSCQMRLQPPPGAPLVACGGCRQVMQVPGVAQS